SNVQPSGAPTETATRRCTFCRPAPAIGLVGHALDPDNGKDQNSPHAIARSATRARPPRSRIRREFNDGAHFCSLCLPRGDDLRGDVRFKARTWLTPSNPEPPVGY